MSVKARPAARTERLAAGLVVVPLVLGLGLRLAYALHAEPFVDEPTTLLVARAIARTGLPILPSGLFYGNDLPYSYLAGGLVWLFGPKLLAVRLLSVIAGTATIGLAWAAGRRLFSAQVGLWAALLLALAPQEVIWGGRARAYAVLGLLALAAAWLFFHGLAGGRAGPRRLGLLLLAIAIFVHPEAALLLPALAVAAAVVAGRRSQFDPGASLPWGKALRDFAAGGLRWWLRPAHLIELALAAGAAAARYRLQLALAHGSIAGLPTVAGSRPPLQPTMDVLQRVADVAPFFLERVRLPWTLLAGVTLAAVIIDLARRRQAGGGEAGLYFSICLWLPPVLMILFLGSTYQSPRYLAFLLPIFSLVASAGLDRLLAAAGARLAAWRVRRTFDGGGRTPFGHRPAPTESRGSWPTAGRLGLAVATALVLAAAYLPAAVRAAGSPEKGFRSALGIVGAGWQPGDRVATVAPAYSLLVLGRSDLFALGQEYEEFVYRAPDGRLVDRWAGSPLVRTAADLAAALDALPDGGRLWLVIDEGRLRTRFEPDVAQLIWNRMELVARTDDVLVWHSVPVPAPAASHPADAVWAGRLALTGYELGAEANRPPDPGWGEVVARPGDSLPLVLRWQAVAPITATYTAFVHVIGADGVRYTQDDRPPLNGIQPLSRWLPGETMADRRTLELPADLPPGRYRLELGVYDAGGDRQAAARATGEPLGETVALDYIRVPAAGERLPAPSHPAGVVLWGDGDAVRLLGYDVEPGTGGERSVRVVLYWQASEPVRADYTVFVQIIDGAGAIVGQGDGRPLGGFYPMPAWDAGEIVADEHAVAVQPGTPPGTYRVIAGIYYLPTGRRLAVDGTGPDVIDLGTVEVGP